MPLAFLWRSLRKDSKAFNLKLAMWQKISVFCVLFLIMNLLTSCLTDQLGGAFSQKPEDLTSKISVESQRLINQAYQGITPTHLVDHHVHILGLGTQGTQAFVNPKMQSWLHPLHRLKFGVYASASGITDFSQADQQYVARLLTLVQAMSPSGKFHILAFDKAYHTDGQVNLDKTEFYVPNEYVVQLAQAHPEIFEPVISVHPYRKNALTELEKWAKQDVKYVKWLPNAMVINPSSPKIIPFYQTMKRYGMVLLSHTGEEQAVEAEEDQHLGNPLLLRTPLEQGVQVIIAHAASLGVCKDLDSPQTLDVSCFSLFLRLMDEKKYEGLLFGEVSAVLQYNRIPIPILTILKRQDLHNRLVNGSDYPLPAVNLVFRLDGLVKEKLLTQEEAESLREIYDYNPLLFDFVLKRTIQHPQTHQTLSTSTFMQNPNLP